jgi:GR25 family glycosyltransferase involved in LPS biosynthesis
MDVYYINLKHSTRRNEIFLDTYQRCRLSERWRLHRFDAVAADSEQVRNRPGRLSNGNKGNFLSHMGCLLQSLDSDDDAFILEDDACLSPSTEYWVQRMTDGLDRDDWDIIMTEMCVSQACEMARFLQYKRKYRKTGTVLALPLKGWDGAFAGCAGYVVNRRAKAKLLRLLTMHELIQPFDLVLRFAAIHGHIKAKLAVPFLTSVNRIADISDTSLGVKPTLHAQFQLWNQFRRLVWIDGEADPAMLEAITEAARAAPPDAEAQAMTALMQPLLSIELA